MNLLILLAESLQCRLLWFITDPIRSENVAYGSCNGNNITNMLQNKVSILKLAQDNNFQYI